MSSSSSSIFCHNPLMDEWPTFDVQKMLWDMLLQTTTYIPSTPSSSSSSTDEPPKEPQHETLKSAPITEAALVTKTDAPLAVTAKVNKEQPNVKSDLVVMMPEGIVSIKPYRISAKATRRRLQTKKLELDDAFQPRPSRLAQRSFDRCLTSDGDIWVERFYYNKSKQRVYFYRSFKTGKCVLSEPPSGAHCIVYMRDLDKAPRHIQQFALERLDKEIYLNCMEKSRPTLPPPTILRAKLTVPTPKRRLAKAPPLRPILKKGKPEQ